MWFVWLSLCSCSLTAVVLSNTKIAMMYNHSSVVAGGILALKGNVSGTVERDTSSIAIGVCWFVTFKDDRGSFSGGEGGQPHECWVPIIDSTSRKFNVPMYVPLQLYAVTMKFSIAIIDSENMATIHKQEAIIDILNSLDSNFAPPAQHQVAAYQKSLMELTFEEEEAQQHMLDFTSVQSSELGSSVVIFLKDLAVHGASSRLVTFGCTVCKLHAEGRIKTTSQFWLGEESGPMLETLQSCGCDIMLVPSLFLPEGQTSESADILSEEINWSLIDLLNASDVLIVPNTLGDVQTNTLLHHVAVMRQLKIYSDGEDRDLHITDIFVALDLCNIFHPEVFGAGFETWQAIVDGLIAPSVYLQQTNWTVSSGKPVEVVYPSLMTHRGDDGSPIFPAIIRPWPRLAGGRFRVGMFGRCSFERSPGLFIRAVAQVLQMRSEAYIRKRFDFVVVGGGSFLTTIQELARELGVDGIITFTGEAISNIEMIEWLCSSDLVVNPKYRGETFGILHAEAMACGTPVVSFNRSASQESLRPFASYLVPGGGGEEGVEGYDDEEASRSGPGLVLRLAEAMIDALERPRERFNWSTEALAIAAHETKELLNPSRGTYQFLSALRELKRRQ